MNFEMITVNEMQTFIMKSYASPEAVDQLIKVFNVFDPVEGKTGTGVDKSKKDSLDIALTPNYTLKIQNEIMAMVDAYISFYHLDELEIVPPLTMTEHFNIQKYPLNGAFHRIHADRGFDPTNSARELVFMTYLNDVHTGGETEFMFYNLKVKPQKGLTLIWPAGWTHLHRGLPAPTTEKIICTGWLSPKF